MEIRYEVINGMLAINVTGIPDPSHLPRLQASHGAGGWEVTAISPQALERLGAAVIADNVEMTGYFADPTQDGVINGVDVVAGVPDLSSSEMEAISARLLAEFPTVLAPTRHNSISANETQDPPPPHSGLPPGSICETCWDQPATQLLSAPWGGEIGVCLLCAQGEEAEVTELPAVITVGEALASAQTLLIDAMQRHLPAMIAAHDAISSQMGVSLGEAEEAFGRWGDALRTFPAVNLDDLVINPSR